MCWLSNLSSVAIYDNIQDVEKIHGHNGATQVEWEPDYKLEFESLKNDYDASLDRIDEQQGEINDLSFRLDGLE